MKKTSISVYNQSAINQTINSTIQTKNNHCSQLKKYQTIELQTSDQIIDQNFKEGLDEINNRLNLKSKRSNSAQIRSSKFSIQSTVRKNQRPNSAFNNQAQLFQMIGTSNQKDLSKQSNLACANKLFIRLKTPKLEDYMKNVILSHSTKNSCELSKKLNQTYISYLNDDMTKPNFLNRFGNKKQMPPKKIVTVWENQDSLQNLEWKQMQQVISNAFPSRRSNSKSLKMKNRAHKHTLRNNSIRLSQTSNRNCQTIGITEGTILLNDAYQKLKKYSMTVQRPQTQKNILNRKKPSLSASQQQKSCKLQNEQLLIGSKAIIHP